MEEAREMVQKSDMLNVLGLTLKHFFLLDQVRKQEDSTFVVEFDTDEKIIGSGYNPKTKFLTTWVSFKGPH